MKYKINGTLPISGYVTFTSEVQIPDDVTDVSDWLENNKDEIYKNLETEEADWQTTEFNDDMEIEDMEQV